jgi:RNA polymerase sigma factor (sigma-70 family)
VHASDELSSLMWRAATGDEAAAEKAMALLYPRVHRYCGKLLSSFGGIDSVEDVTQEAMVKTFEDLGSYDPTRPAMGFALGRAYFACRTEMTRAQRRRRRDGGEPEEALLASMAPEPEEALAEAQHTMALRAALQDFSEEDLIVLGQGVNEAVEGLALSAPARRKRKQRLLGVLRQALGDIFGSGRSGR